jgi:hypothetical protein
VVSGDDYLIRLTRYIHLNPAKIDRLKKMSVSAKQNHLADWPWSSYRGYINRALEQEMVDYRWLGLMGCRTERGNRNRYRKYVEGFLGQQDELLHKAMTASRYAIGDKEFIEEAEEELKNRRSARAICGKDVAWPRKKTVELEAIEEAVENEFGISKEDLHYHGHRLGLVKALTLELCCQLTGKSQREIGRYFGYTSDASVGKQRKRLAEAMSSGKTLARKLTKLKKTVLKDSQGQT